MSEIWRYKHLAVGLVLWVPIMGAAEAREHRSAAARDEFKRDQPCPSTGKPRGPCPGYIIDHVIPLCAGGPDSPLNMEWQTVLAAKAKDRGERRECRELRRSRGRDG